MGAVRQWLTRVDRDPGIGRAVGGFRHLARLWYLSVRYAMDIAVGLDTVSRSLYAPGMLSLANSVLFPQTMSSSVFNVQSSTEYPVTALYVCTVGFSPDKAINISRVSTFCSSSCFERMQ